MRRPVLLDLFCGAGGAAVGYQRAGFDVFGVDLHPQPNYPFDHVQADALVWAREPFNLRDFDAIHASPPCQFATAYRRRPGVAFAAKNWIPATQKLLDATFLPYVIENVEQARPWLRDPIRLCGSGAYQYIGSTWRVWFQRWRDAVEFVGSDYDLAYEAPPLIQDAVTAYTIEHGGAGNWSPRYGDDPCTVGMGG